MTREHDHQHDDHGASQTPRVLVFFDYACPFCFLDWPRFKRLRSEHTIELFLVPFELRPQLALSGVPMSDIGDAHSERVEEHMMRMAREGGLEFLFPDFMPNTHAALALAEFARDMGPQEHERVHEAIFAAYNGRGEDIGDVSVLERIAGESGLDAPAAMAAIAQGRYDERLHQFLHMAVGMGISATPAALICNELLIGSRPYQVLSEAVDRCNVGPAELEREEPVRET